MVLKIVNLIITLSIFSIRGLSWKCNLGYCYYRSPTEMLWIQGVGYCGHIYSTIASIHSYSANWYINNYVCGTSEYCWIGLTDQYSEGTYRWTDGTSVDYTRWDSGEPNDWKGAEDATAIQGNGYWNDDTIADSKAYVICMKPGPTPSPTREPSNPWPTCQPTTLVPTTKPSPYPTTQAPTNGPTMLPTVRPTYFPSILPSLRPTYSPSVLPSIGPTHSPSHFPTLEPSRGPSTVPSSGPTSFPSVSPSMSPTVLPSYLPSVRPTTSPSVAPTVSPSIAPSLLPSVQPTTLSPTMYPSQSPTSSPTVSPTFPIAQYCIERVKLHITFIVLVACQIITICALLLSILLRSGGGVVSPEIFSPNGVFIDRIGEQSKPEEMSMISAENIATGRVIFAEHNSNDEVEETDITPY